MPHVRLDDCLVYYEERGRGAPLLLLMGLGGSHRSWGEPFLEALAARFRIIALDHRGTGRSTRGGAPYSMAQLATDAAGVLAALGIERAHVLGLSMGGMVAQELALGFPERVGGLILASTNCGGPEAIWPSIEARRRFAAGLGTGESLWPLVVSPDFVADHGGLLRRIAWQTLTAGTTPTVLREQAGAVARFSTYVRLPRIGAPTLVMAGDRDALIPPANAHVLQRRIPGAEGAIVRGTGHIFVWEAPVRSAAEVTRFLSGPTAHTHSTESLARQFLQ